MAERKTFPLRMDPAVFEALQRWADAELRSLNGQIEYMLREALRAAGRNVRPRAAAGVVAAAADDQDDRENDGGDSAQPPRE